MANNQRHKKGLISIVREKQLASQLPAGPSALDEIRQAEADTASKLYHAQQEAQTMQQAAKDQAVQIVQQAQQAGELTGQTRCEQLIKEAQQEAEHQIAEANTQVDLIIRQGQAHVRPAVDWAVRFVLGIDQRDWQP